MTPLLLDTNLIIYRFRSGDLVVERMMRQRQVRCSAISKV